MDPDKQHLLAQPSESSKELPEKIRAFIALRMNPEVDEAVGEFVKHLRKLGADVNWVKSANFHLTLRFLGPGVAIGRLPAIAAALRRIASGTAAFSIITRGIGGFPSLTSPRVIWVGLESEELVKLAKQVEEAMVTLEFEPEHRAYSPHLTIGRVRQLRGFAATRAALEAAVNQDFGKSRIESIALYRSILSPKGATYQLLERFGFAAPAAD